MVSLMTALWFGVLEAPDRVCVKPHASPVLHAINYLLGRLDRSLPDDPAPVRRAAVLPVAHQGPGPGRLLDRLGRARRDGADLGRARAPLRRGALRRPRRRAPDRADRRRRARRGRLLGGDRRPDGEQARRGHVGRRPQPPVARPRRAGHRRRTPAAMFEAAGWHCVMVKYGPRLAGAAGAARRDRPMPNEEYQRLLRAPARASCASGSRSTRGDLDDAELLAAFRDLGGHDLGALLDGYRAGRRRARPPERRVRLHDQGLEAADRGPSRPTTRRCSPTSSSRSSPRSSAPTRTIRGRGSPPAAPRPSCARRRRGGWSATSRRARVEPPAVPPDLGREHKGASRPSRRSGASSSTSRARRRTSRRAS